MICGVTCGNTLELQRLELHRARKRRIRGGLLAQDSGPAPLETNNRNTDETPSDARSSIFTVVAPTAAKRAAAISPVPADFFFDNEAKARRRFAESYAQPADDGNSLLGVCRICTSRGRALVRDAFAY